QGQGQGVGLPGVGAQVTPVQGAGAAQGEVGQAAPVAVPTAIADRIRQAADRGLSQTEIMDEIRPHAPGVSELDLMNMVRFVLLVRMVQADQQRHRQARRDRAIAALRAQGITAINGQPIETAPIELLEGMSGTGQNAPPAPPAPVTGTDVIPASQTPPPPAPPPGVSPQEWLAQTLPPAAEPQAAQPAAPANPLITGAEGT